MYMTAKEIKQMCLNPNKTYIVKTDNLKKVICNVYLQTDFCFYFIYEKKVICISKIDYYIEPSLIREVQNEAK